MNGQFPSTLLEKAVNEFAKLPGVGRKTAMRLVLHLLRQDTAVVEAFGNAIVTLKHEVNAIIYQIRRRAASVPVRNGTLLWFVW